MDSEQSLATVENGLGDRLPTGEDRGRFDVASTEQRSGRRARILLTTEGTYPFAHGGVSTWCDIVVNGLSGADWSVLPITAGGIRRPMLFELPANAKLVGHIDLWSERVTTRRTVRTSSLRTSLAAEFVLGFPMQETDCQWRSRIAQRKWMRASSLNR